MDNKKKFEIEFDDDFDSWLAQREQAMKTSQVKKPVQPARPAAPAQPAKPAAPAQPARPAAPAKPARPAQPARPAAPVQPVRPAAPVQPVRPAKPARPAAPVKSARPAAPAAPAQPVRPAKPVQPADVTDAATTVIPPIPSKPVARPDARQFKPVQSDSGNGFAVNRKDVVKNFKIEIDENEYSKPAYEEPSLSVKPAKKDKSIYFAGRKPSKAQIERRHAQDKAREERKRKDKQTTVPRKVKEYDQVARLSRVILLVAIIFCSSIIAAYGISCINDVLAISRSDELVTVDIEKGSDYNDVIKALDSSGLIKHRWFCKIITKFRGFDEEKYLYGKHYLTPDMGVEGMLTAMLEDQVSDKTIRLSFPEGWTIPQIIAKLDENNVCPAEYIYDALKDTEFDYGFVRYIPTDEVRCYLLEGYIFPDTYDFFVSEKENGVGENPTSILNKFLGNFETKWNDVYAKRAEELGITLDEVITIASIIEKEAADKSQMTLVSSVIHNRLNHPGSYPTLGCDSTKKYVTNYLAPVLGSDAANAYIGSYDTNSIRSGLPAGPICNPGIDAIEAALNPDDTNYYYFCHNENGKIYMAETYAQFRANWAQVLRDNEGN